MSNLNNIARGLLTIGRDDSGDRVRVMRDETDGRTYICVEAILDRLGEDGIDEMKHNGWNYDLGSGCWRIEIDG